VYFLEKYLLALKCLLAASSLSASHPTVHEQIVRFQKAINAPSIADTIIPKILELIKEEFTLFPKDTSLEAFNEKYATEHKDSAKAILAVSRTRQFLSPSEKNAKDVVDILGLPSTSLEEGREGLELLREWNSKEVDGYAEKAAKKWPEAAGFKSNTA